MAPAARKIKVQASGSRQADCLPLLKSNETAREGVVSKVIGNTLSKKIKCAVLSVGISNNSHV